MNARNDASFSKFEVRRIRAGVLIATPLLIVSGFINNWFGGA